MTKKLPDSKAPVNAKAPDAKAPVASKAPDAKAPAAAKAPVGIGLDGPKAPLAANKPQDKPKAPDAKAVVGKAHEESPKAEIPTHNHRDSKN